MAAPAARVVVGLGYGLATILFLKNSEGVGEYLSELARTSIHFLSRAPKDRSIGDGSTRELGELSEKLDRLALGRGETVHIHHGGNKYTSWFTTVVGGTVIVVIVAHVSGLWDFSGLMYVTQSKFKTATDALKEGVATVNKALQAARKELLERMGMIEMRIDNVNAELKDQIATTSATIRDDVAKVSFEVKGVGTAVTGIESKLGVIENGVGELRIALEKANQGIQLLCHVVAESYRHASQKDSRWYSDLLVYTKNSGIENGGNDLKQLKQNGEGPVMRLISTKTGPQADSADNGGGAPVLASLPSREKLVRSLSEAIGASPLQ